MTRVFPAIFLVLVLLLPSFGQAGPGKAKSPVLHDVSLATEQAPEHFTVRLKTTKGPILIEVTRAWAPLGADRFYNLVKAGFYDKAVFFRVIIGFMAQVGIHGDPSVAAVWHEASIPDDPVVQSNTVGMVAFATAGPNTRTTQFFISLMDNSRLDESGFSPFGIVRDIKVADKLWGGYGEGAPQSRGPNQDRIREEGDAYLAEFPKLDSIISARVIKTTKPKGKK